MAKSIRSKRKRKMRAVKRERYGKKELEQLKTVLGLNNSDIEMKEEKLDDIVIVKDASELKAQSVKNAEEKVKDNKEKKSDESEPMDDGRRIFNKKTLKDQHGNYPVWLGSRKIKKAVKRNQSFKKSQKKQQKKGRKSKN